MSDKVAHQASECLARGIRRERERHGLDQQQLADRLDSLGLPIDRTGITRIELGKRKVTTDELVTFAYALDVPLAALLLPLHEGGAVRISPSVEAPVSDALPWMRGDTPLPGQDQYRWGAGAEIVRRYVDLSRAVVILRQRQEQLAAAELSGVADERGSRVEQVLVVAAMNGLRDLGADPAHSLPDDILAEVEGITVSAQFTPEAVRIALRKHDEFQRAEDEGGPDGEH